ncbi:hypothetical protein M3661_16930 [Paenibacillus sp. MER 180]|uniref:hypothetical protein n=1 Tax=Paenibacillus sp. MER 180 TaxID=2939570 RepID=UPI00203B689F|nr:hypothetical protein [Paenibacillus sp. MER 180]MCM3291816.1 hypothetical protein [Paenibacillus sp. MER 180]
MFAVYLETQQGMVVTTVYMNPTPEQMKTSGVEIDSGFPTPNAVAGMVPVLKVDVEMKQLYFDYERPDTIASRVQELQKENTELKLALAELAEMVAGGGK